MRAVARKGLALEAEGKKPVFSIRGREVDLQSALHHLRRKGVRNLDQILNASRPATPEAVKSPGTISSILEEPSSHNSRGEVETSVISPTALGTIQAKDCFLAPNKIVNMTNQSPSSISQQSRTGSNEKPVEDLLVRSIDHETISAFQSFLGWYLSRPENRLDISEDYFDETDVYSPLLRSLALPDSFRFIEHFIRSSSEIWSIPQCYTGTDSLYRLLLPLETELRCGHYDRAFRYHKQATEAIPGFLVQHPFFVLSDIADFAFSGLTTLVIENALLPLLTQMLRTSIQLHSSRHPLTRVLHAILAVFKHGLLKILHFHVWKYSYDAMKGSPRPNISFGKFWWRLATCMRGNMEDFVAAGFPDDPVSFELFVNPQTFDTHALW